MRIQSSVKVNMRIQSSVKVNMRIQREVNIRAKLLKYEKKYAQFIIIHVIMIKGRQPDYL